VAEHDLVIRGGTVVDGTGRPRFTADVGVDDGVITYVGPRAQRGGREVDAEGLLVTPGWVDVHSHYDGQVMWDPVLDGSSGHGVTTVVIGNCGVGFAPARPEDRDWLVGLMEGVEDIPGDVLRAGIDWSWESFPEFLGALARTPLAIDVGAQVPHAAVRIFVMGERGQDFAVRPSTDEVQRMAEVVVDAVRAGALGFSTSRSKQHRSSDRRVIPTYDSADTELLALASALGRIGRGVIEISANLEDFDREFGLIRSLCEVSRRPTSISLVQRHGNPPAEYRRQLALTEEARRRGLPLAGQATPRPPGYLLTLEGNANPLEISSAYQSLRDLPRAERVARLRQPAMRRRIVAELEARPADGILGRFPHIFRLSEPARYDLRPDANLREVARREQRPFGDLVYDALLEREGRGVLYGPAANFADGNLDATREILAASCTIPGLGDGGALCTMICDANFPTFHLAHWGRDVAEDQRFSVESIVKNQSADTARWVGLEDRGRIEPGCKADLNVIDLDALELHLPQIARDLPLGGRRLVQKASGYRATIVTGEVVVEDGEHTGALPGALARAAPQPV
jgi:N-acyl-D-aspartate/D-glutamate deacylase